MDMEKLQTKLAELADLRARTDERDRLDRMVAALASNSNASIHSREILVKVAIDYICLIDKYISTRMIVENIEND